MTTNGSDIDGGFLNVRATPSKKNILGDYEISSAMTSSDDELLHNKRPRLDKGALEERESRSSPSTRPRNDIEDPTDRLIASARDSGNEGAGEGTLEDQLNRGNAGQPSGAQQAALGELRGGNQPSPHELFALQDHQQQQRNLGMIGTDPSLASSSLLSSLTSGGAFPGSSFYGEQHPMGDQGGGPLPDQQMASSLAFEASLMDRARARIPNSLVAQQLPRYMLQGRGMESLLQSPGFNNALLGETNTGLDSYMLPMTANSLLAQRFPHTMAHLSSSSHMGLLGRAEFTRREVLAEQTGQDDLPIAAPPNPDALTLYVESDEQTLSQYQCAVRKQIELFTAEEIDVENNAQGRNKPIVLGQVGIRCLHCASIHPRRRSRGGTYYPSKLSAFYQAAQNMASDHLLGQCTCVPHPLRRQLIILKERKSTAGGGKAYWATAAQAIGVVEDTEKGILRLEEKQEKDEDNKEGETKKEDKLDQETGEHKEDATNDGDVEVKKTVEVSV